MVRYVPQHVAIIMDGNGRWAKKRRESRLFGHKQGAENLRLIVEESMRQGVKFLTAYTFSTENWKRPKDEVSKLMSLFKFYLETEDQNFQKEGIRLKFIGNRDSIPKNILKTMVKAEERTQNNHRFVLVLAFNYGGREEIVRAVSRVVNSCLRGECHPSLLTEQTVSSFLDTALIPDPDLMIRTGGDMRLSNFLLWQCAYSELFFTNTFWPDFSIEEYQSILKDFSGRERRWGMTSEQIFLKNEQGAHE